MNDNQYILHVDGDAFFAACEVARRPDLKGKPVVVGEERGIACALTYEAKKLGVHRGMPIFKIRKEFPKVTVLSSHFDLYNDYHKNLVTILRKHLPVVCSYSIDECFALMPAMPEHKIESFVRKIKKEVQDSLGVTFSFGVAATKTLAKTASKKEKPDGCVVLIDQERIRETLKQTQIGSIWGIGRKTSAALIGENIITAFDFVSTPLQTIKEIFSEPVVETWLELHGKRIYEVDTAHEDQKTIQATRSFAASFDPNFLFSELSRNVEVACEELRKLHLLTNAVHIFYKEVDGSKFGTRNSTDTLLEAYTDDPRIILGALRAIINDIYTKGSRYKSTGITCLNLKREEHVQEDLFGVQKTLKSQKGHLKALDAINQRFGEWTIMHASSLKSVNKRREENIFRAKKDSYEYGLPLPFMGEVF